MPVFAGAAPTKRVCMSISSDNGSSNSSFSDVLMRIPICLPVNTTRWRLKFANSFSANVITLSNMYVGVPGVDSNGQFLGNITSPVQVFSGASTVAGSGRSDYTTPWNNTPSQQFFSDVTQVVSIGITCAASTPLSKVASPAPCIFGAGSAAQAGTPTPTGSSFTREAGFLDIQLEYEFVGTNPTVLIVGDSLSVGYTDWSESTAQVMFARLNSASFASWPGVAGLKRRFGIINASVGGKTFSDFASLSSSFFTRFDFVNCPPDYAILSCGSNESANLRTVAQFVSDVATQVANMQSLGCKRIFMSTIFPRLSWKAGFVTTGSASGVNTLQTSVAYANNDVVDIDYENSSTSERLTVSGASTGNGPYTTTFTGNTTKAHDTNATIWTQYESRRRDLNQYIRSIPNGINGVFDFAKMVVSPINDGVVAREYGGLVSTHFGALGYARAAQAVDFELP